MFFFHFNESKYYEFIRNLRNMDSLKDCFLEQDYITQNNHLKYMEKYQNCYYIATDNDIPIGYIGVVNNDLRLAVIPEYQNRGVGTFMLQELEKINKNFSVKIISSNQKSINFFKKFDFVANKKEIINGIEVIYFIKI